MLDSGVVFAALDADDPDHRACAEDLTGGAYVLEQPTQGDVERCLELQLTYADLKVGVVDASVLVLVERLGEPKLATLDHRHFGTMRPRRAAALELLPS